MFGKIIVELFAEHFKSSWTIENENAWKEFFALLSDNFAIGLNVDNNNDNGK